MQLKLAGAAFKGSHFNDTGLFQEVKSDRITLDIVRVLDDSGQRLDDVNGVIPFIVDLVDLCAGLRELAFQAEFDHVENNLRVRKIAYFEYVVSADYPVEARGRRLQIVQSVSHVSLCSENDGFNPIFGCLQAFKLNDLPEPSENLCVRQLCESDNRAPGLDRLNNLR